MNLTDQCLKGWRPLEDLVLRENQRQLDKWGVQTRSPFEWLAYITEELGELSNAISENYYQRCGTRGDIVKEAIQTATLLLKIAEMFQDLLVTDLRKPKPARTVVLQFFSLSLLTNR